MWFLLLLPFIAFAVGFYFYHFLRRAVGAFGVEVRRGVRVVLILCAVVIGGCSLYVSSPVAVVILHVLGLAVVLDVVHLVVRLAARGRELRIWRKVYACGVIPCVLTAAILLGGYVNMYNVVQTNYTVYTEKAIAQDYRIALVADVHFGISLDETGLAEVCDRISAQNVDVVILCGDIVDESTTADQMRTTFELLGGITSKYGIFYVYGNHDRLGNAYTAEELAATIVANGIRILRDTTYQVTDEFVIVGREDRSASRGGTERAPLATLFANVQAEDFVLSLDHQPNQYAEQGAAGADLILSGHTHGGQLFPLNFVQEFFRMNDVVYGKEQIDADTTAIVTAGLAGWRYPIKTAAPAEYVIIEIEKK